MEVPKRDMDRITLSRDRWKERALELSQKVRKETEATRHVRYSREEWKKKYEASQKEIDNLKKKSSNLSPIGNRTER